MKKFILLFLCMPVFIFAQVNDDFEDGDFTNNPTWTGTQSKFKINDTRQLQLNDVIEGEAYLSTASTWKGESEWQVWVKFSFSPSSNNSARIFLVSDNEDVSNVVNGYFLQLGEAGSGDAIELFKKEGSTETSICRGVEGLISSAFEIRIKVTRSETGFWEVFADPTGGDNFQFQCSGFDNTFGGNSFLSLYCKYTVSNSTKFYFDDIYAGPVIVDTLPPKLISIAVDTDTTLKLTFSETVDSLSAVELSNYFVNGEIGNPKKVFISPDNSEKVNLIFDQYFKNGELYSIAVSNVKDLAGNLMEATVMDFSFYHPYPNDVLFSEIMADPSPSVGLPDYEYLELFNQTKNTINLDDWVLTIGSSEKVFENAKIEPNGYLILGKTDAENELSVFGSFYGFSSFSLTNTGQSLVLVSPDGDTISQVVYSDEWYNDLEKKEGGWSLEQINPANICSANDNWSASENALGGTPGELNSINNDILLLPEFDRLEMVSDTSLRVYFNQLMNPEELFDPINYEVDQEIGFPSKVISSVGDYSSADLLFEGSFVNAKVYQLKLGKALKNCIGLNLTNDTLLQFGIGNIPEQNDIVINEILFNPWTKGVDYVEIYNRSDKVIDLSSLRLGTGKISPPNPTDTTYYSIVGEQYQMIPATYLVLTSSPEKVKDQYYTTNSPGFIQMEKFPSYNNDEGICLLQSSFGELVDVFDYSEKMHYPLLNYEDGVSLERISQDSPTQDENNWHSASESIGFGTPAYKNSQFVSQENTTDDITIDPEIFSPDNDGYNDNLSLKYKFSQAGYMLTVNIYNSAGQMVRKLVNNEYLGTEGMIFWDGIQNDNTKASIGIYILYIQVFDLNGNVTQYKKTAVLASKI